MFELNGLTALVTGATGGLGGAMARHGAAKTTGRASDKRGQAVEFKHVSSPEPDQP